ncbi:MAG: SH3 domain-containing protein [Caldilinea sp. CFX5]|nr:SH3 domain-containing protein [Caldilinea sp. CFX5]
MNAQPTVDPIVVPIDEPLFPSLTVLRAAHNKLLEAHRTQADAPDFWPAVEQFVRRGSRTGVLLDREEDRWAAQSLLDYWTATAYSTGRTMPDSALVDFDPSLAPALPDDQCPYVGLASFREGQEKYFFGRERLVNTLAEQVAVARLVAVVGSSGSGKSSLVLAGLIPLLKSGALTGDDQTPSSAQWRYLDRLVPGSEPLTNLAHAFQTQSVDGFRQDPAHLVKLVNASDARPVLLVVDQFEELFTLCTDEEARTAFINNLLALVEAPGLRHTVILTMRTDFESFVARVPQLLPHFEKALVRVTPLNAAELRAVIEKPAEIVGLKFEASVVDALVQDVLGEPAALPLLQFTLLKLWEQRDRNRITWESYKRLGGGRLALARSADQLYESLIPEDQVTARRILLRLVRPGDGLEVTSNRVRQPTLYQSGEARDRVDRVLQKLVKADLLRLTIGERPEDNQVEVAHEALVRNWPRLVGWLEDERERIRERLRVTAAAEQWLKVGRDAGALLRGALLEDALRYNDLSELEQHYVKASQAAVAAVEQEKEAARQRELEQARALAAEQERLVKSERHWAAFQEQTVVKLRQRAWLLGVITAAAILLAAAAFWFSIEANRHSQEANTARQEAEQQAIAAKTAEAMAQMEAAAARTAEAELLAKQAQLSHLSAALNYTGEQLDALEAILRNISATVDNTNAPDEPDRRGYSTPAAVPVEQTPTAAPAPAATPAATPTAAVIASLPLTNTLSVTNGAITATTGGESGAGDDPSTDNGEITEAPISITSVLPAAPIMAIVPDIAINLYAEPSEKSPVLRTLRAPDQLTVLQADAYWVKVATADGTEGWVEAYALTYIGDTARLPIALQYRVAAPAPVQNESKTPFTYGEIISVENAAAYPLLDDLQNPASILIDAPVGAAVTLLFEATGPTAYGSERWYYVQLSDPGGKNLLYQGYLPAAVIVQR